MEPGKQLPPKEPVGSPAGAATGSSARRVTSGDWLPQESMDSVSGLDPEGSYAQQLFTVGKDAWDAAADTSKGIHTFTQQDFPHQLPEKENPVVLEKLAQLQLALDHLKLLKEGDVPEEFTKNPQKFLDDVLDSLPSDDSNDFKAGGWTRSYWSWEALLTPYRSSRPATINWLLKSLREGVQWDTVIPLTQVTMPKHQQKVDRAVNALKRQSSVGVAWDAMHKDFPPPCSFPNHPSAETYKEELSQKFAEYVQQGVVMEVPEGKAARVGCSLGGVFQNNKVRPIIDPLVTNLFLKYQPVRYEQLSDICNYAQKGDWATTTDEKSGYHHMALHPSMWNLLGFNWEGKNYVFTHVPFGVGPACRAYTLVKQELYRIVREIGGVDLTFFIDDMFAVARTQDLALFQLATILRLLGALGFTISKKKLQLPAQKVQFLGMLIDLLKQLFEVPEEKVLAFKELVEQLGQQVRVNDRQLAKVAGKMVSFRWAVGMAPLYAQLLFKAYQGKGSWDELYPTPALAVEDMQWFASRLDAWNGKSWVQNRKQVLMAGDYGSNTGMGAFFPDGEMSDIEHSLTDEQLARVKSNDLSSTEGELLALLYALETTLHVNPALLRGNVLHYQSDNQGAVADVNGMKGCANVLPTVRKIWDVASAADVDLMLTWHPRETQHQQYADHLSKLVDNSSWSLDQLVFTRCLTQHKLVKECGGFTVDVFSDGDNCKVYVGGEQRFYSRMWCKGTSGVDGFLQPWDKNPVTGKREFCYIYGEFGQMGRILHKVQQEKVNCVIIYPVWPRHWGTMWKNIPVRSTIDLSRRAKKLGVNGVCKAGPRVDIRTVGHEKQNWKMAAAVVIWDP